MPIVNICSEFYMVLYRKNLSQKPWQNLRPEAWLHFCCRVMTVGFSVWLYHCCLFACSNPMGLLCEPVFCVSRSMGWFVFFLFRRSFFSLGQVTFPSPVASAESPLLFQWSQFVFKTYRHFSARHLAQIAVNPRMWLCRNGSRTRLSSWNQSLN